MINYEDEKDQNNDQTQTNRSANPFGTVPEESKNGDDNDDEKLIS